MSLQSFTPNPAWKEKGVAMVLAHPDDEALMWGMVECLCRSENSRHCYPSHFGRVGHFYL